ncbi:MAG: CBS domain-containing protein [Gammaproteobacteria bacterium]|nr:CBS domain-containing protein [Gammaproteobacteria bacterium]
MAERSIRDIIEGQDVLTIQVTATVAKAADLMKARGVGAILVLEGVNLVGIFTERDALYRVVAEGRDPTTAQIAEVMTANPTTVHPDSAFSNALEIMHVGRFRHVPVVDQGRPIGMVSSLDAMGPELEQFMYAVIVEEQTRDILA